MARTEWQICLLFVPFLLSINPTSIIQLTVSTSIIQLTVSS